MTIDSAVPARAATRAPGHMFITDAADTECRQPWQGRSTWRFT
jgi:hypothetical protein